MGIQLFTGFRKGSWNGTATYNASVTRNGALVLGGGGPSVPNYVAGQAIFRSAGFEEWAARWRDMRIHSTLRSQFDRHVSAGLAGLPFTGEHDLELARPNRFPWPAGAARHHCNW